MRDSRSDWARIAPGAIPTKTSTPALDAFLEALDVRRRARVLDLGCGDGRLSRKLCERGFTVVGVDINEAAVESARERSEGLALELFVRDVASPRGLELAVAPFDAVVCQLVISVVGDAAARRTLLRNAFDALRSGGRLYLSASGVSDTINPGYAQLYEKDFPLTGERHTYFSRDADGNVLYTTHHFEGDELRVLLRQAGFEDPTIEKKREASSRRPNEAAYFFYASCRKRAEASPTARG